MDGCGGDFNEVARPHFAQILQAHCQAVAPDRRVENRDISSFSIDLRVGKVRFSSKFDLQDEFTSHCEI